jgi:hypothetical protein
MRNLLLFLTLACLPLFGSTSPRTAVPVGVAGTYGLLPPFINGWEKDGPSRIFEVSKADSAHQAILKELNFTDGEVAAYVRQGRKFAVKAYRFNDATGAFAAYSALRPAAVAEEKFCDRAASHETTVIILCGNAVLLVDLDKVTGMTASEMRSLASQVPRPAGNAALSPTVPRHLPKGATNVRMALGPVGLAQSGTPLPADIIDFSKSAEVAVGSYPSDAGDALLTIAKYPTFALATDRQKAIQAWIQSHPRPAAAEGQPPSIIHLRRVGPLVAVVTGTITEPEALALAEQIPYDVEVTQSEPVYNPKENIGNLVVNMLYLAFIIIAFTLVTGVAFGGFRLLARKYFPGRFVDRPEEVEFIKLDLRD